MSIRKLSSMDKVADWEECPDCGGKGCNTCKNSGNPGYVWMPRSGNN